MKLILLLLLSSASAIGQQSYDLIVYGGNAAGVMTAVSGARQGLKTVLLEPRDHIGGLVSGGLSGTDIGRPEVIGGMALEFYGRAGLKYNMSRYLHDVAWLMEARVAETIFNEMLRDAGVAVHLHKRLREKNGVSGLKYPLASDITKSVCREYGVLLEDKGIALRGLFIIDPEGVLQYQVVHSLNIGRNVDEALRVLQGLQSGGRCPIGWKPGQSNI